MKLYAIIQTRKEQNHKPTGGVTNGLTQQIKKAKNKRKDVLPMQRYSSDR